MTPPLVRSPDLAEKDIIDAWKTAGGLAWALEGVQAVDQADQRRSVSQSLDPADYEHAKRLAEEVKLLREMCPHLTLDMAVVLLKVCPSCFDQPGLFAPLLNCVLAGSITSACSV